MQSRELYLPKEHQLRFRRFSVDVDGVVASSITSMLDWVNQEFGTSYRADDVIHFDWVQEELKEKFGVPLDKVNVIWSNPDIMFKASPVTGAIDALHDLSLRGAEIFFVTARSAIVRNVTYEWFARHFPFVSREQIFIRQDASVHGKEFKIGKIKALDVEAHIEDGLEIVQALDGIPVILLNSPWNQHGQVGIRKNNWDEIYRFLIGLD